MIKVDNAIIMAAGFGSRFVPVTFSKPKGLVEVGGEPLVERQIKQLKDVGIDEIIIVVGYKAKAFEYLVDKYGVKLVNNPDYNVKNNISSIYYVRDYLRNSYLLTSDIYMPENIYTNTQAYSWYALRYFEGEAGEWGCQLDDYDLITHVDRFVKDGWAMYGPAFFDEKFSEQLIKHVEEIYDDEAKAQYYWEDVYMEHLDEMRLYGNKLSSDAIVEFESLDELRAYDKTYNTKAAHPSLIEIAKVFNVGFDKITNFIPVDVGMTNKSFLFEVDNKKYVYRLAGEGTEVLITRSFEYDVYQAIEHLGISDEILYFNSETGAKITRFFENARMMDKNNFDEMAEAMAMIRSLHHQELKVSHAFDLRERIAHYKSLCDAVGVTYYEGVSEHEGRLMELGEALYASLGEPILCHIDPAHVNFLYTQEGIKLLDWEYSGMAYPLLDVAMCGIYHEYNEDDMDKLLEIYLEHHPSAQEKKEFYTFIALAGFLWTFWTLYKEHSGVDFGTYGMDQFNLSKKYYEKAVSI